jgi:hypothetical protein
MEYTRERKRTCEYPNCPLRHVEDGIAGKEYVDSLEARVIKLEGTHDRDVDLLDTKISNIDKKFDAKFTWIIGIGIVQLTTFVISLITGHILDGRRP